MDTVKVINQATGETHEYYNTPDRAVVLAYEQYTVGNWNVHGYLDSSSHPKYEVYNNYVKCGNWVAKLKLSC